MMHEQNDRGQFERFLQDSLKDFRMTAGKRVWTSIYNNLHPSRRWPAFSTMVLFVCCLSFFDRNHRTIDVKAVAHSPILHQAHPSSTDHHELILEKSDRKKNFTKRFQSKNLLSKATITKNSADIFDVTVNTSTSTAELLENKDDKLMMNTGMIQTPKGLTSSSLGKHPSPIFKPIKLNLFNSIAHHKPETDPNQDSEKQQSRFGIAYTITPSVGYRLLRQQAETVGLFPVSDFNEGDKDFYQRPTMNMEVGALVSYKLNRKLSLLTGLQLNYMGYNIEATEWEEPIPAELQYQEPSSGEIRTLNTTSTLAKVIDGSKNRHNYHVDLSIPIGFRFLLLDEKKWQCHIQGTLQPGLKISDKTAMISANQSSYIYEPKMVNQWTMHAGMSMQISIPVDEKLHLNFGPSLRYQLSRQFQSSYVFRENRYNAGITISLMSSF
jgi:hypothetical protein